MLTIDEGVTLVAPGGLWLAAHDTLVVADVHAGTVATLQHRGVALPSAPDDELYARLRGLLDVTRARTLVVAGDLVHGRGAVIRAEGTSALDGLRAALRGTAVVVVEGNHDRAVVERLRAAGLRVEASFAVGPHTVAHGDEAPESLAAMKGAAIEAGGRLIVGHHHPALTLRDGAGTRRRVAAFAYAEGLVCLPALSPFARGSDLRNTTYSAGIEALAGRLGCRWRWWSGPR